MRPIFFFLSFFFLLFLVSPFWPGDDHDIWRFDLIELFVCLFTFVIFVCPHCAVCLSSMSPPPTNYFVCLSLSWHNYVCLHCANFCSLFLFVIIVCLFVFNICLPSMLFVFMLLVCLIYLFIFIVAFILVGFFCCVFFLLLMFFKNFLIIYTSYIKIFTF